MVDRFRPLYCSSHPGLYEFVRHPSNGLTICLDRLLTVDLLVEEIRPFEIALDGEPKPLYTLGEICEAFDKVITTQRYFDPTNPEILWFPNAYGKLLGSCRFHYLDLAHLLHDSEKAVSCYIEGPPFCEPYLVQPTWLYNKPLPYYARLPRYPRCIDPYKNHQVSKVLKKVLLERGVTVGAEGIKRSMLFRTVKEYLNTLECEKTNGSTVYFVEGTPFAKLGRFDLFHSSQLEHLLSVHCREIKE